MRIAIISDIHDRRDNFDTLLSLIQEQKSEHMFILGDLGAPWKILKWLLSLNLPAHIIRGNNDGEVQKTTELCLSREEIHLSRTSFAKITIDHKHVVLSHYPVMKDIVGDHIHALFYGHTHMRKYDRSWPCMIVNPGAVLWDRESSSFALRDTHDDSVAFIEM